MASPKMVKQRPVPVPVSYVRCPGPSPCGRDEIGKVFRTGQEIRFPARYANRAERRAARYGRSARSTRRAR